MKDSDQIYRRYQDLQSFVGWTSEDAERIHGVASRLQPHLPELIDDFFEEIGRHPEASRVMTGDPAQLRRLHGAVLAWLIDMLVGPYDRDYVLRRWNVGARHAEIGLDQVYTNAAISRLRDKMIRIIGETWHGDPTGLVSAIRSLNKLMDLDLAKIEDAYQAEYAARLQTSERLATLGQIAGGVAHELRNPLNVVKTSLYYLKSDNPRAQVPEKRAEHMRRIERNVELANEVITTLTNFAKMPEPRMEPFKLEPFVRRAIEDLILPTGVMVEMDFQANLPAAIGDRDQIGIVLSNLIRNAVDAMPNGGRLHLSGLRVDRDLELKVTDNGIGIPSDIVGRIMDPLFSTKARGMGLGLALSRMIMERNQGCLEVRSEVGKGSTFTIRLVAGPLNEE